MSLSYQVDQAGCSLAGIDGVEQDAHSFLANRFTASTMDSVGRE